MVSELERMAAREARESPLVGLPTNNLIERKNMISLVRINKIERKNMISRAKEDLEYALIIFNFDAAQKGLIEMKDGRYNIRDWEYFLDIENTRGKTKFTLRGPHAEKITYYFSHSRGEGVLYDGTEMMGTAADQSLAFHTMFAAAYGSPKPSVLNGYTTPPISIYSPDPQCTAQDRYAHFMKSHRHVIEGARGGQITEKRKPLL